MNLFDINVFLVIAISMLPGVLYFVWFQAVGRKKAYIKFLRERALGKPTDWQQEIMEVEEKRCEGIRKVKANGLMAFDNDIQKVDRWLNTPIPALKYKKPIDILDTLHGVELVKAELLRIEHSVY